MAQLAVNCVILTPTLPFSMIWYLHDIDNADINVCFHSYRNLRLFVCMTKCLELKNKIMLDQTTPLHENVLLFYLLYLQK